MIKTDSDETERNENERGKETEREKESHKYEETPIYSCIRETLKNKLSVNDGEFFYRKKHFNLVWLITAETSGFETADENERDRETERERTEKPVV